MPPSTTSGPRVETLLRTLEANPTDTPAFRTLEEELFVSGNWSQLAAVYQGRLDALSPEQPEHAQLMQRLADLLHDRLDAAEAARPHYETLVRADPSNVAALGGLRRAYVSLGNLTAALQIAELEEQVELPPAKKGEVLAEIAQLWLVLGDAEEARRYFDQALALVPACDSALRGLASLAVDAGDTPGAIALHERRLQSLRGSARSDAMEELAALLPPREAERARSLLGDVIFADPSRLGPLRQLLELERSAERWGAVEELEDSLWAASEDTDERRRLALQAATRSLEDGGDPAAAAQWLMRANEVAPDDPEVQQLRARIYRRRGDSEGLIDALERLEELEGPSTMRKLEIAVLHETADRPERAAQHLHELLARAPGDSEALEVLERCLERTGDGAGRIELFERKLTMTQEPAERATLWTRIGDLHAEAAAHSDAERGYRQALECVADHPEANQRLHALLRKTERWPELTAWLEANISTTENASERAKYLCELAQICLDSQDAERARQHFAQALQTDPECSTALRGLRTAAEQGGDLDALFDACERELALDPTQDRQNDLFRDLLGAARKAGDTARARAVGERWASLDASPDASTALVELAREEGDIAGELAALETLETLLHDRPAERGAALERLGDLSVENNPGAAFRWYREAIDANAESAAREKLISLCRREGRRPELAEQLRSSLERVEGQAAQGIRVELSRVLAELGDFVGATDVLFPAFDFAPEDRDVADLLESLLAEQDRIEELTDFLGRRLASERDPGRRRELAHRCAGLLLDALARPVDAVSALHELADPSRHDGLEQLFERALEAAGDATRREHETWLAGREQHVDPSQRLDLLLCLARLQQQGGRLEPAIESLRRAERLARPEQLELVHGPLLGLVREQGDPEAQLELLARLLEDVEDTSTLAAFHLERARILVDALDQPQQALDELDSLDCTALGSSELRLLAGLYGRANAIERRIAVLSQLTVSTAEPEERLQIGLELSELLANGAIEIRNEARAETLLRELKGAHPEDARIFDRLSLLLESSGQSQSHAELLRERLARDDLSSGVRTSLSLQLARILEELDLPNEAVELLEDARKRTCLDGEPAPPLLDEALLGALERAGLSDRLIELCEEKSSEARPERSRWLRRWLDALDGRGDGPEARLAVVERLLEVDASTSLHVLRVSLLRALGRNTDLAASIETLLAELGAVSGGRRRGLVRELLRACEGELDDPERALALIEREVEHDETLAVRGARLAARLGAPEREAALLAPRIAAMQDDARPEEVRQLALAHMARGCPEDAEPLMWRAHEAHPHDRDVLAALETILRDRDDAAGLLRLLDTHFQLEAGERRALIAREGVQLSARAEDAPGELTWIRRCRALERLSRAQCERWLELERSVGQGAGTLEAIAELRELIEDPQQRARLLAEEASLRITCGQLDLARLEYEQAIRDTADPPAEWLQALDGILDAQGRSAERAGILSELSRHPGLSARERVRHQEANVALLASSPDRLKEAAEELRTLLDADTDEAKRTERRKQLLELYDGLAWPTAWCELAESLLPSLDGAEAAELEREIARRMGQELCAPDAAIKRWRRILEREPEDLEALAALAELLDAPGQEAARADVLELYAGAGALDAAEIWLEAARLRWTVLRDSEAALQDLDGALSNRADLAEAHELRCDLCAHLGDHAGEIESLRALLESNPHARSAPERWLRLAELLVDTPSENRERASEEAREAGAAALSCSPSIDRSVRARVRRVFERCGEWSQAADLISAEIQVASEPEQPSLLRRLLRVQWDELHNAEEAARTFASLAALESLAADELERRAEVLAALERWGEALEQREKALELRPDVTAPGEWIELARDLVERADAPEEAIRACGRALEVDPKSTEALELRAELCHRVARPSDELEDRIRLGELHTDEVLAAEALAGAGLIARDGLKDSTRAWGLFHNSLRRDASNVAALEGAGRIALERSEWSEAERLLGMASALLDGEGPRAATAARGAAEGALQQSRYSEAFHHLERALEFDGGHAQTLDRMAEVALQLGAHERAKNCLEARLAQEGLHDSDRAERMARLAQAREGLGDEAGAAAALASALELKPDDEVSRARVVDLLEKRGDHAGALEQVNAWLEAMPAEFRPALELRAARIEVAAERREDARARLERLLSDGDGAAEAWVELANLVLEDDATLALNVTERGLPKLEGEDRAALLWLQARAYQKLERPAEAARSACDSLCADPTNIDAARLVARQMGQSGEFRASVTELERVLDASRPEAAVESELWEAIGRAYAGPLEDVERAERAYRRALEANPARTAARESLADITAFDPGSHAESVRLHRELLASMPAREPSWRALQRIADHWKRAPASETCALVLRTLGQGPDHAAQDTGPLLRSGPVWSASVQAGLDLLRAREDAELLPATAAAAAAAGTESAESAALRLELTRVAGRCWALSDDQIRELWRRPLDEASLTVEGAPRKARKKIKKSLRNFESSALRGLDIEAWRAALLCEAAAKAVTAQTLTLREALLDLLECWPATKRLDLRSGGDLGAALQLCEPARGLLLRVADATLASLGL